MGMWLGLGMGWLAAAAAVASAAPLGVLVLPTVPMEAALATPAGGLSESLEKRVRTLRGVRVYHVQQQNVHVEAANAYMAMACTTVECAADLAQTAGVAEVLLGTLVARGNVMTLRLFRVAAKDARTVATSQRMGLTHRWHEMENQLPDMVRELFPERRTPPPVIIVPPPDEPAPAPPTKIAADDGPSEPMEDASWLLPPLVGAGTALGLTVVLGGGPFLLATAGLGFGTVYLVQLLQGALMRPDKWTSPDATTRAQMHGLAAFAMLWPAIAGAPLAMVAPALAVMVTLVSWWVPRYLWARKPLGAWLPLVTSVGPIIVCTGLLVVSLAGSLLALGSYMAPWAGAQNNVFRKNAVVLVALSMVGVAAGSSLAFVGAGLAAVLVGGTALLTLPLSVGVALGWDQRPLRDPEHPQPLPVDELQKSLDGRPGRRTL